jgi:hypothetical protein
VRALSAETSAPRAPRLCGTGRRKQWSRIMHHTPYRRSMLGRVSWLPVIMIAGAAYAVMRLVRNTAAGRDGRRASVQANQELQDNARKALAMKQAADARKPPIPESQTAHEGMHSNPNRDIAPSGALEAEGFRPAFERGGRAR